MIRRDMKAAKVKPAKDDKVADFHSLRVSFVTWLVEAGTNPKTVQILARHSTIELTMRLYTDPALFNPRRAVENLARDLTCNLACSGPAVQSTEKLAQG